MDEIIRRLDKLCEKIESSKDSSDFFFNLEQYINYMADVPTTKKLVEDEGNEKLFNEYQRLKSFVEVNNHGTPDLSDYSKNRYLRRITDKISVSPKNSVADDAWFWEHVGFPDQCKKIVKFNDALVGELAKIENEKQIPTDLESAIVVEPVEPIESKVKDKSEQKEVELIKIKTINLEQNRGQCALVVNGHPMIPFNEKSSGNTKIFKIFLKLWICHYEEGLPKPLSNAHWVSISEILQESGVRSGAALEIQFRRLNRRLLKAGLAIRIETQKGSCRLIVKFG